MDKRKWSETGWLDGIKQRMWKRLRSFSERDATEIEVDIKGVEPRLDTLPQEDLQAVLALLLDEEHYMDLVSLFGALSNTSKGMYLLMQHEPLWRALATYSLSDIPRLHPNENALNKNRVATVKQFYDTMFDHYRNYLNDASNMTAPAERWRTWKRLVEHYQRVRYSLLGKSLELWADVRLDRELILSSFKFGDQQNKGFLKQLGDMLLDKYEKQYAALFSCPESPFMFGFTGNRIYIIGGHTAALKSGKIHSDLIPGSNAHSVCCAVAYPSTYDSMGEEREGPYINIIVTTSRPRDRGDGNEGEEEADKMQVDDVDPVPTFDKDDGWQNNVRNRYVTIVRITGNPLDITTLDVGIYQSVLKIEGNVSILQVASSRTYLWMIVAKEYIDNEGGPYWRNKLFTARYNMITKTYEALVERSLFESTSEEIFLNARLPIILDPHHDGVVAIGTRGGGEMENLDFTYDKPPAIFRLESESYRDVLYFTKFNEDHDYEREEVQQLFGGNGYIMELVELSVPDPFDPEEMKQRLYIRVTTFNQLLLNYNADTDWFETFVYIPLCIRALRNDKDVSLHCFIDHRTLVIVPRVHRTVFDSEEVSTEITIGDISDDSLFTDDFRQVLSGDTRDCSPVGVERFNAGIGNRYLVSGSIGDLLYDGKYKRAIAFHNGTLYVAGSNNMLVASATTHEWGQHQIFRFGERFLSSSEVPPVRAVRKAYKLYQ